MFPDKERAKKALETSLQAEISSISQKMAQELLPSRTTRVDLDGNPITTKEKAAPPKQTTRLDLDSNPVAPK